MDLNLRELGTIYAALIPELERVIRVEGKGSEVARNTEELQEKIGEHIEFERALRRDLISS